MANLNITNIPAPRVPFIDERTGLMAREWYRFFLNLFILTGSGSNPTTLDELQIGPPNQPDFTELLIQINKDIAPQYEDQSGDFLKTLDTAQLMSMMSRFENAEAAIQGAYLQPVVQTGTIANYNLDGSPTLGGVAYGTGPALAVSAAGSSGQVLTSAGAATPTWTTPTSGTVTSVTGSAPVVSSGGTTPAISMAAATTSVNGYLTSTDWNTFNGKGSGSVTSVAASVPAFLSISGSPVTTSGTLAITLSGTALPVLNGGTGVTTSTGTGNTVLSASPTFSGTAVFATLTGGTSSTGYSFSGSAPAASLTLTAGGNLGVGTLEPNAKLDITEPVTSTIGNSLGLNIQNNNSRNVGELFQIGMGNISPHKPMAVIGTIVTTASFYGRGDIFFATRSVTTDTAPTERMRIDSDGIVTMSAYGAGAATFSAAGVISSVSDETWKVKDGVPTDPDAMLKKLNPGYWYYNDEKKEIFGVDRQLGFYAQNVNAAIGPEAAPTPEEGKPWGYYDRSVLAITVMSLQKALATIESLTARITALESKS